MRISIITICFNNERDIRPTLESVVRQTYTDIEYIIKDGGSTDSSLEIAREFQEKYSDRFAGGIRIVSSKDKGIYDALNQGIEAATGDVVGFIHAGDRLYDENVVAKIAAAFEPDDCDIVYGGSKIVSDDGAVKMVHTPAPSGKFNMRLGYMPTHMGVYTRRSLFGKYGLYLTDFGSAADYEWVVRYFYMHRAEIRIKRMKEYVLWFSLGGVSSKSYKSKIHSNYRNMINGAWKVNGMRPFPGLPLLRGFWVLKQCVAARIRK